MYKHLCTLVTSSLAVAGVESPSNIIQVITYGSGSVKLPVLKCIKLTGGRAAIQVNQMMAAVGTLARNIIVRRTSPPSNGELLCDRSEEV